MDWRQIGSRRRSYDHGVAPRQRPERESGLPELCDDERLSPRREQPLIDQWSPSWWPSRSVNWKLPKRSPSAGRLVGTYGLSSDVFGFGRLSRLYLESFGRSQFRSMNFGIEA